ncbi:hypothetical protein MKW94_001468 [Papaver nudicaule]|uniref:Cation/H+ exchanger domain-containing protein n=1 Tax=Papaver nudicaule TaxID=74823 RepID=A0AA41W3I6_PAPNU|nr:hypothetical protein [Papaver nudicaule]
MQEEKLEFNCQPIRGLFEHGSFPYLTVQIAFCILFYGTFNAFLSRFDQIKYVSSVLAGFVLGPGLLGGTSMFQELLSNSGGMALMEHIKGIGLVFFAFFVGVKTDMDMVTKASRSTIVIGFCAFVVPLLSNETVLIVLRKTFKLDQKMSDSLAIVLLIVSFSSFYDIACAIANLNLLNSEIGRLGLPISIITGLSSWSYGFANSLYTEATSLKPKKLLLAWMGKALTMIVILFVLRPVMWWMNRNTPEGKTLKEGYVSWILVSVLVTSFCAQAIGIDSMLGPLLIGLTVPVGSPIAAAVQKKLECFLSFFLLPTVYIIGGYRIIAFNIIWKNFVAMEIMILLAYSARLIGLQTYVVMVFTNLLFTMVVTPTVKYLYEPSRKYAGYKRQTILNSSGNSELRILACVYNQENVPSILNFLEATNPVTTNSFVCIYVLHLVELVGRATSLLIKHKEQKNTQACNRNSSDKIIYAFHQFGQYNQGFTIGQCYTAISPVSCMDNDISQIALDKRTTLVIIPFGELVEHPYHAVTRSVIRKAPCSMGILFDHKNNSSAVIDVSICCHNVAMVFIGGPDDREALAYSIRMADKSNINLSVFQFTHIKMNRKTKKDDELISHLWGKIMNTDNIMYKEEEVTDCGDTASRIKCLEDSYDFIIVGRRHDSNSPILIGLDEWCVFKELGLIGDLFASSNSQGNFSVLVMQH